MRVQLRDALINAYPQKIRSRGKSVYYKLGQIDMLIQETIRTG